MEAYIKSIKGKIIMKQFLVLLLVIIHSNDILACSLQLKSLEYEPIRSKSDFQKQLRKEIARHWNDKNCASLLLSEGIIRKAEKIKDSSLKHITTLQYALKEITGFPDTIIIESIQSPFYRESKRVASLNIEKYFEQIKNPQKNDLVVYINDNLQITLFGIYQGPYTIRSKMGVHPYIITHILLNTISVSKNDGAIFFTLRKEYQDRNCLIKTMQKDNLQNILKIFYYKCFLSGEASKKHFIPMYSRLVSNKSLIDHREIKNIMKQYEWKKRKLLCSNTSGLVNLAQMDVNE